MSQNLIVKPLQSQSRLKLNIANVDELFSLGTGDFVVFHGSRSISYLTSLLCVRAQLPPQIRGLSSGVVFVDIANAFRLYQVSRLAQLYRMAPRKVLFLR